MMKLYINTKDQGKVTVALKNKGKIVKSWSQENKYGSQVLLSLIEKLIRIDTPGVDIRTGSDKWKMLEEIEVETGPGSFTGLRVGVSVANALGFALGIPVNGKKIEDKIEY